MLTMPVDAVGKKYTFMTKMVLPDGRGGVGVMQFAGQVLETDAVCVRIRENLTNDILTLSLDDMQMVREESAVKTVAPVVQIPGQPRRGH